MAALTRQCPISLSLGGEELSAKGQIPNSQLQQMILNQNFSLTHLMKTITILSQNLNILMNKLKVHPSSTDISLGYPGDGLTDELDVQCYVPWTSSDNPNVATYDIKMRYP